MNNLLGTPTNPLFLTDSYKLAHILMYKPTTETVFATWTPRTSKYGGDVPYVIVFGVQPALKNLLYSWEHGFFERPLENALADFESVHQNLLGIPTPDEWIEAITNLHKLGYLPLEIRALPEGTRCPIQTPYLTIRNTDSRFGWLPNFIETWLSSELWLPATSATTAYWDRVLVNEYAEKTGVDPSWANFVNHDFSARGMENSYAAMASGAAHLLSSWGTDSIMAFPWIEMYYGDKHGVDYQALSVPASEHSVMCSWGGGDEDKLYEWLVTERFSTGILSIVSDTWDLWHVVGSILPSIKDKIMARDGRIVIRPDSGVPEDILCGDASSDNLLAQKGLIECLWDIFGGEVNEKGYKVLDTHIGVIYGDGIVGDATKRIYDRLMAKGFSISNLVFGRGSYTYTYVTRDTFGFALKTTYCVINGDEIQVWKDPVTDRGFSKKSHKGLVTVNNFLKPVDNLNQAEYEKEINRLEPVFVDGDIVKLDTFKAIRERIWG